MFLGSKIDNKKTKLAIQNKQKKCRRQVKLLGITIDEKPTFTKQVTNTCSLSNNRLRALTRIRRFLSPKKTELLSEAYIMLVFNTAL